MKPLSVFVAVLALLFMMGIDEAIGYRLSDIPRMFVLVFLILTLSLGFVAKNGEILDPHN